MLFLAITGALTIGILVGSGATIGRQRYRDSVHSFKKLIQEQYGQIANVINSEPQNPTCTPSAPTLIMDGDHRQDRGTSECLVIGRFVLVQPTEVTTYNLIGQLDPAVDEATIDGGDSAVLSRYFLATELPETHAVNWGARVVQPKSTDDVTFSMMVVRSPLSGAILTYVMDGDMSGSMGDMIGDEYMARKDVCLDPDGGLLVRARRQAVRIQARAANQSAIEIPPESEGVCE